jgi:dethiobiotin synthetase
VAVNPSTIAQAVANVALAHQSRVHLKGIVLNCVQPCQSHELEEWASIKLIQNLTQKPVLGCIPHLPDPTDLNRLTQVAAQLELERLIPLAV